MRRSAILLAIAATACSQGQEAGPAVRGEAIACAHGPDGSWDMSCQVERSLAGDREVLVIRRADGAFRRLAVLDDGRAVEAADGAARVSQRQVGGTLEISLGDDRYRLPIRQGLIR